MLSHLRRPDGQPPQGMRWSHLVRCARSFSPKDAPSIMMTAVERTEENESKSSTVNKLAINTVLSSVYNTP